jgi:hypothetical protein
MWLARRDRNATLPDGPGLCLGDLLAVLLAPPRARENGPCLYERPFLCLTSKRGRVIGGTAATNQMRAGAHPRCRRFPAGVCMAREVS